jgi:hypothetical protein
LLKDYGLAFRTGLCFFFAPAATFAYSEINASRTVVRTLANWADQPVYQPST